jgi:hypothetical protein
MTYTVKDDRYDGLSDTANDNAGDEKTDMNDVMHANGESKETHHWWIKRAQEDAEVVESLLQWLERGDRGPQSLRAMSREYRKFADSHAGLEPLSRDRLYGALILLALSDRVRIYGDRDDVTARTTFQALPGAVSSR